MLAAKREFPLAVTAVALDLDGTLLDTAPDLVEAANRMQHALGLPLTQAEVVKTYIGHGAEKLIKRLLTGEMHGEPEAAQLQAAKVLFFKHYAEVLNMHTRAYDGVMEGLTFLQAAGFRLACVTNKPAQFTLPLLKKMGLEDYFELVLSGDSLPAKKPDPMPLLHVCERFGISPDQLVMVGDSAADIEAANAARCYAFYVPYGYNSGLRPQEMQVDAVLADLQEIKDLITKRI